MKRLVKVYPLACFFLLLWAVDGGASFLHAPHNEANGITCVTCHQYPLAGETWPGEFPPLTPTVDDTFRNFLCLRCHGGAPVDPQNPPDPLPDIPVMQLHSSLVIQGSYTFTTQCTDCHDPHFQEQLQWTKTDFNDLYLVSGTITKVDQVGSTTEISYDVATVQISANWTDYGKWSQKTDTPTSNGRGLVLVTFEADLQNPSDLTPQNATFEVQAAQAGKITVTGMVPSTVLGKPFGLIYGQLIRAQVSYGTVADSRPVKFFDPVSQFTSGGNPAPGGFVDQSGSTTPQGICQVCHTNTLDFRTDHSEDQGQRPQDHQTFGTSSPDCTTCHLHETGFTPTIPNGTGQDHGPGLCADGFDGCSQCHNSGHHAAHLAASLSCTNCHDTCSPIRESYPDGPGLLKDGQHVATTTVCDSCHYNPTVGGIPYDPANPAPPNNTEYRTRWDDPSYSLACDGCHNGRPSLDTQVMSSNGHERLVGENWIRHYPCTYCHNGTVDDQWHLLANHTNGQADVIVDPRWNISGLAQTPTYDPATKTCDFLYCHSDGTTVAPEVRAISWTNNSHKQCNACHGHDPAVTDCTASGCHTDGRDASYWDKIPEKRWLTAMPMYKKTDRPGSDGANSHFRHLFTGYACDECHANTVAGGSCLSEGCHGDTVPPPTTGAMTETAHVNGSYHVNGNKDVVFKQGGTYNPTDMTCSNTACHVDHTPQWGDTVDNIPCRNCHGTTGPDNDDFGKFNGNQAKINLAQWEDTGHGRPLAAGNYPYSDNPPADFPENGCWYCHDNKVLHQDDGNPFRLREHAMFKARFEKECVFCHMQGQDSECLGCHNTTAPTLAPQLVDIGGGVPANPPYSGDRPDHSGFVDANGAIVPPNSCGSCHVDNDHRHKTESFQSWTDDQKEDIKNDYVRMGVCLICHDDDSTGECTVCHTDGQHVLGFDPGLTGTYFITATKAKATSMHFGYKHFQEYDQSVQDPASDLLDSTASADAVTLHEIVDTSAADAGTPWSDNQWIDRYVFITSGANAGLSRLIVKNSKDHIFVEPPFPANQPMLAGDSYTIKDVVWKGGKFCWDCHDPHGDSNYFMIQDEVATRTDGRSGKPLERATVTFRDQANEDLYYAKTAGPVYDGICNVCHTDPDQHYGNTWGDGHNEGRRCTQCHEHRFSDSHSSGKTCNSCHLNRPLPRHTGFSLPRDCTKCHAGAINGRKNIMGQFSANSHHIQGVNVDGKKCYVCHWEATELGLINVEHHQGYNYKTHEGQSNGPVDLVIWGAAEDPLNAPGVDADPTVGGRPIVYDSTGTDPANPSGKPTVTQFTAADMATSNAAERLEIAKITPHCLGCHSDQNNDSQPFGDCKTPRQYSWDGSSVDARYSQTGTTTWGKYGTLPDTAPKNFTKAFSAHGNAVANEGGFDPVNGLDGDLSGSNTRDGQYNVQCFDCHSSHGSKASGTSSSYVTFNGTYNGANLKETTAGKGGYQMTYYPSENPDPNAINFYNTGAGLCFDCHETETASSTPWGYSSTYGATAPIIGYNDNPHFFGSYPGKFSWRSTQGFSTLGGHLRASNKNPASPNYDAGYQVPASAPINGLCTSCHDPHGVSPTLGQDKSYAVPILKGTWLTSPYKEDDTPTDTGGPDTNAHRSRAMLPTWKTDRLRPPWDEPGDKVFAAGMINEDETRFAGLCLRCHAKDTLTDGINKNTAWKSVDRIHEAVKGWGNNAEHNYPCSKCHQPHASGLPRLLRTNCLDVKHRGQVASGGIAQQYNSNRTFPTGGKYGVNWRPACHESSAAGGGNWDDQLWNTVSPW